MLSDASFVEVKCGRSRVMVLAGWRRLALLDYRSPDAQSSVLGLNGRPATSFHTTLKYDRL